MKKKTTKITELVIDEENEALAIDAISLVSSPALEVDFVFFGKEKNNLTFAKVDEENFKGENTFEENARLGAKDSGLKRVYINQKPRASTR